MTEVLPEPERRPGSRPLLGELLVNAGLVTPEVMAKALAEQQRTGLPIGRILVESGYVPGHRIAMALADQHGGPVRTEYGLATGHARPAAPAPLREVSPDQPATLRVVESVPEAEPSPEPEPEPRADVEPEPVPAAEPAPPPVAEPALAPVAAVDEEKERLQAELERADASLKDVVRLLEQEQEARGIAEAAAAEARRELETVRAQAQAAREETVADEAEREQAAAQLKALVDALSAEKAEREQAEQKLQSVAQMLADEKSAREQAAAETADLRAAAERAQHDAEAARELEGLLAQEREAREEAVAEAAELRAALESAQAEARTFPIDRHVLFLPGAEKYALLERSGPPPAQDAQVEVAGETYTVLRLGPAPLPDRVACAFLERVGSE
jgi:DNA repair exonuclease SbcCD ATPase subunit